MAFKHQNNHTNEEEEKFITSGRGETEGVKIKIPKKMISAYISVDTLQALKAYETTEAKRFESRSYIIDAAIQMWLASKGL